MQLFETNVWLFLIFWLSLSLKFQHTSQVMHELNKVDGKHEN